MYIDVCGLRTFYEIHGQGKEILFLHGWGANTKCFSAIMEQLSNNFKVIALDFPGFGESEPPKSIWGVSEYADFIRIFLEKINVTNPILLGHSFGGRVIIYLTGKMKHPAHKIILVDSAGIKPKRSLKYYYKVYTFKLFKNAVNLIFPKNKANEIIEKARGKHGSQDYKNASGVMKSIMVKVVNEDLKKYCSSISAPTLLVWGDKDEATPLKDANVMTKLIPDSGLAVLKNAGHFSFLDKPYEFSLILNNFISEDAK